jgi:hypothetical protein
MDVQEAAQILEQARAKAEHELRTTHPAIYGTWALVYFAGPAGVWGVLALAIGGAFFVLAAMAMRQIRS